MHLLSDSLKDNGLRVGVGLGLDLSLSLLGLIRFPYLLLSAHLCSVRWALNKQPVGVFNVLPVGLHSVRWFNPSAFTSLAYKPYNSHYSYIIFSSSSPAVSPLFCSVLLHRISTSIFKERKGKSKVVPSSSCLSV